MRQNNRRAADLWVGFDLYPVQLFPDYLVEFIPSFNPSPARYWQLLSAFSSNMHLVGIRLDTVDFWCTSGCIGYGSTVFQYFKMKLKICTIRILVHGMTQVGIDVVWWGLAMVRRSTTQSLWSQIQSNGCTTYTSKIQGSNINLLHRMLWNIKRT